MVSDYGQDLADDPIRLFEFESSRVLKSSKSSSTNVKRGCRLKQDLIGVHETINNSRHGENSATVIHCDPSNDINICKKCPLKTQVACCQRKGNNQLSGVKKTDTTRNVNNAASASNNTESIIEHIYNVNTTILPINSNLQIHTNTGKKRQDRKTVINQNLVYINKKQDTMLKSGKRSQAGILLDDGKNKIKKIKISHNQKRKCISNTAFENKRDVGSYKRSKTLDNCYSCNNNNGDSNIGLNDNLNTSTNEIASSNNPSIPVLKLPMCKYMLKKNEPEMCGNKTLHTAPQKSQSTYDNNPSMQPDISVKNSTDYSKTYYNDTALFNFMSNILCFFKDITKMMKKEKKEKHRISKTRKKILKHVVRNDSVRLTMSNQTVSLAKLGEDGSFEGHGNIDAKYFGTKSRETNLNNNKKIKNSVLPRIGTAVSDVNVTIHKHNVAPAPHSSQYKLGQLFNKNENCSKHSSNTIQENNLSPSTVNDTLLVDEKDDQYSNERKSIKNKGQNNCQIDVSSTKGTNDSNSRAPKNSLLVSSGKTQLIRKESNPMMKNSTQSISSNAVSQNVNLKTTYLCKKSDVTNTNYYKQLRSCNPYIESRKIDDDHARGGKPQSSKPPTLNKSNKDTNQTHFIKIKSLEHQSAIPFSKNNTTKKITLSQPNSTINFTNKANIAKSETVTSKLSQRHKSASTKCTHSKKIENDQTKSLSTASKIEESKIKQGSMSLHSVDELEKFNSEKINKYLDKSESCVDKVLQNSKNNTNTENLLKLNSKKYSTDHFSKKDADNLNHPHQVNRYSPPILPILTYEAIFKKIDDNKSLHRLSRKGHHYMQSNKRSFNDKHSEK